MPESAPPSSPNPGFLRRLRGVGASPALRVRDFRLLWSSGVFLGVSNAGQQVVVGWLVLQMTGDSRLVGVTLAIYFLPLLLFGLPAGALADWLDRRRMLRAIEAGLAVTYLGMGLLVGSGEAQLWHLLAMTFAAGAFTAMVQPVRLSFSYDIVGRHDFLPGLGLLNVGQRLGNLGGALVAGRISDAWGPEFALFALAAGHAIALGLLLLIRTPGLASGQAQPILRNFRDYAREIRVNRTLMLFVALTGAVEIFGFSFATALPALVRDVLDGDEADLGALHAFRAIGSILASIGLAAVGDIRQKGRAYLLILYAFGLSTVLLGLSPMFAAAAVTLTVVAGASALSDIFTQSLMQLSVRDHLHGRAMGAWIFALGTAPLGHLQMGFLAGIIGVGAALIVNGVALLAVTVVTNVGSPRLRKL
ncbi:MAG: MFS transporter [SAR202 cluster bacterium]|nr:MFS transporter [SAR202 cluster bacterium]